MYDYFEENWTSYVVQEYISGITLLNYINKKGRMEMKGILLMLYPVRQPLQQLHQAGLLTGSIPIPADFYINYREVTAADGKYACQVILKDTVGEYHASGL